jgi:hypothetical protein
MPNNPLAVTVQITIAYSQLQYASVLHGPTDLSSLPVHRVLLKVGR